MIEAPLLTQCTIKMQSCCCLLLTRPVVVICITNDISLREGVADLHFDYFDGENAFAFYAVFHTSLDEDMLTVAQLEGLVVKRHHRGTGHYYPVLVPQLMTLQAQSLARLDD